MASLGEALDGDEIWVVRGGKVWWSRCIYVISICGRRFLVGDLEEVICGFRIVLMLQLLLVM